MKPPTRQDLGNVLWAASGLVFMLFIFLLEKHDSDLVVKE